MDNFQDLFKEHWEKVLLGFVAILFLLSVGFQFLAPPPALKAGKEIVSKRDKVLDRINKSKPSGEPVPSYGEMIKKPYTENLVGKPLAKWTFYRKPYIWKTRYSGPVIVKKTPYLDAPEDLQVAVQSGGIRLSWKHNGSNRLCVIVKTEVYRKIQGKNYELIGTAVDEATEFLDTNVASKMAYSYYVKSYAKCDPSRDDVQKFRKGNDNQTSETVSVTTLPDIILDIEECNYGEIVYNFIKKEGSWKEPSKSYICPKGKAVKIMELNKNGRQGKKATVRFILWKLDQDNKKFQAYTNDFRQKLKEGDPVVVIKTNWKGGKKVFQYIDSGYQLIRIGRGHFEQTLGSSLRDKEVPVIFMVKKSVNHHLTDMSLSVFGIQGEDEPVKVVVEQKMGKAEKAKAEAQLKKRSLASGSKSTSGGGKTSGGGSGGKTSGGSSGGNSGGSSGGSPFGN